MTRDPMGVIYIVEIKGPDPQDQWGITGDYFQTIRDARKDIRDRRMEWYGKNCRYRIVRYRRGGAVK
jgi:hypothetical protein